MVDTVESGAGGSVAFGPFLLEGIVGRGATSTVYLARVADSGDRVAVKVLDPALASVPGFGEQLERESTVLARLAAPHLVRTRGTGVVDGTRYLAMDYVDGASLRSVERTTGRLGAAQALGVLAGALEGLASAHAAGLVHGDVKPENILCDRDGRAWLCDFGQVLSSGGTTQGGTPAYMSPETVRGRPLDARADLYSMGVVLFEALAGQRPFDGANDLAVMSQHAENDAPPLTVAGPATRALVARALSKDPALRPQTAAEFLSELEAAATADEGSDWRARAAVAGLVGTAALGVEELAAPTTAGAAAATSHAATAPAAKVGGGLLATHPVITAGAAVVLVAGLAAGGVALSQGGHAPPAQPTAATAPVVTTPSYLEVEKAMCAKAVPDGGPFHCAMYSMKVSKIDPRWILAQGVGLYAGTAIHPRAEDGRSDGAEGVYDAKLHKVVTLDHVSDCASEMAILAPVPPAVAAEWGFVSCSAQESTTTTSTTTTTTLAPSSTSAAPAPTVPVGPASAIDLSQIAGSWGAHEQSITISGSGQGTITYADLNQCPSCSFGDAPPGTMTFQLTGGGGTSATGTVTSSSDPSVYQVGAPVTAEIAAGSPGQVLDLTVGSSGPAMYCNSTSAGQCGA